MCPAIHINSRSWLRSSSTHEPSDPPPRVVFLCFFPWSSSLATILRRTSHRRFREVWGLPDRLVNYCASSRNFVRGTKKMENRREKALFCPAQIGSSSALPEPSICAPDKPERDTVYQQSLSSAVLAGRFFVRVPWYDFATFIYSVMILPQVHLRKPCYDFYFL